MGNQLTIDVNKRFLEQRLLSIKRGMEKNDATPNAKLVKTKFIDAFNLRDMATVKGFCGEGSMFCFMGAEKGMPLHMFMKSVAEMHASFPDIVMTYDGIKEVEPGVVKVYNVRTRGTHTGKSFAFPPFPPVPTSGILVEETSNWTVGVAEGKMTVFMMDMEPGDLVGPVGYYIKIGGQMR